MYACVCVSYIYLTITQGCIIGKPTVMLVSSIEQPIGILLLIILIKILLYSNFCKGCCQSKARLHKGFSTVTACSAQHVTGLHVHMTVNPGWLVLLCSCWSGCEPFIHPCERSETRPASNELIRLANGLLSPEQMGHQTANLSQQSLNCNKASLKLHHNNSPLLYNFKTSV